MPEVFAPGSTFAGYVIEAVAGQGGMGVVYRVRQVRPNRHVALKVIAPDLAQDQDFRRRFERESEVAAAIEHPNVIPVYEVGEAGGSLFIAMRFIEGTDLRALLRSHGRLEPAEAAALIGQVAAALDAAHERGLVHRDVKPGNVLIAGRPGAWHAYLTDFGLTKSIAAETGLTTSGMFVGTLDYIAPEQLTGERLDARADVYALGCVLFETLTGRVPYPRDTVVALMYAHGNEPPPSAVELRPELPREFDAVIARAMAKDRDERFPSAGDLGRAAAAAARSQQPAADEGNVATGAAAPVATMVARRRPPAAQPTMRTPTERRRRLPRRAVVAAVAALAVVLIAAIAVIALSGGGGTSDSSGSSGPPRLSRSVYDSRASAVANSVDFGTADRLIRGGLPSTARARAIAASRLDGVRTQVQDAADMLGAMVPPANADEVHSRATELLRSLGSIVAAAEAASRKGDSAAFKRARDRWVVAQIDIQNVTERYKRLGYPKLGGG